MDIGAWRRILVLSYTKLEECTACRLIPEDKNLEVRTIGIREVLRRVMNDIF